MSLFSFARVACHLFQVPTTMNKRRRMLVLAAITWLSLVTTLVQSLSSHPFPENSARGKAIRSSAPVASPEEPTRRITRGSPQDVSFVSSSGTKQKRRKRPPTPLVDSTLLRFLSLQKTQTPDLEVSPTQQTPVTIQQQQQQQQQQPSPQQPLGQYNRHLVATRLSELPGVSPALAIQAGNAVQQHVLQRTARRRLRLFLRKRDEIWDSSTTNNNSGMTFKNGNAIMNEKDASSILAINTPNDLNQVIQLLLEKGLTGTDICTIFSHTPSVALMRPTAVTTRDRQEDETREEENNTLDSTVTRAFTDLLSNSLKLRKYDARKVLRNCPGLLTVKGSKNAQHVVTLLSNMGVSTTSLARDKNALPVLLSRSPAALFRFVAFLSSDAVRMNIQTIGPLLRRADCAPLLNAVAPVPRLQPEDNFVVTKNGENEWSWKTTSQEEKRKQINNVYRQMSNTAWTLRHEIGTKDLGKVIAAYPSVLLLDAETKILPTASYLMNDLGIWQDDLPRVLQLYPVLLGMDVEDMKKIVNYLLSLEVSQENLASIFRAFPSLFQLDIEKDMEPVIQFLRDIGITNVGRFITRLPPILGYSVEDELMPKWEYLCRVSTQGSFELSAFPAYFSYPLDKRIKTRFEYLQLVKRIPTQLLSLDKVLRYGDKDFCARVARDVDDGAAFMEFAKKRANAKRNAPANNHKKARGAHRKSANDKRIT